MKRRPHTIALLLSIPLALPPLGGCVSRAVPERFSDLSAASPRSGEAPKTPVNTSLQSDPPLPDAPAVDSPGLTIPASTESMDHAHHHGHSPASGHAHEPDRPGEDPPAGDPPGAPPSSTTGHEAHAGGHPHAE